MRSGGRPKKTRQQAIKATKIPVDQYLGNIQNPLEAAAILMISIARMDHGGKVSDTQAEMIKDHLTTQMSLNDKMAHALTSNMREASRELNRAQSTLLPMAKILKREISKSEAQQLRSMLENIANCDSAANRNQTEFISAFEVAMGLAAASTKGFYLAQINIARFTLPPEDTANQHFINSLDAVNAIAEAQDGFVWRLVGNDNNATDIQIYDDPNMIVNMSVWRDLEALFNFVYKNAEHRAIMKRRKEWFENLGFHMALWWVPEGHTPTVEEGLSKLDLLASRGPTSDAFDFKTYFPPET